MFKKRVSDHRCAYDGQKHAISGETSAACSGENFEILHNEPPLETCGLEISWTRLKKSSVSTSYGVGRDFSKALQDS